MELEEAIRTRRTHKAFRPEPLDRATLIALFELAEWAPNHHLSAPWRFRVVGPMALAALKQAAGPQAAPKLDRCPTLIACSADLTAVADQSDQAAIEEELHATACAAYIVLLAAHGRGFAGYWRTPEVAQTEPGRAALGINPGERFVGLLHLGRPAQLKSAPPRPAAASARISFLD